MSTPHTLIRFLKANAFFAELGPEAIETIAGLCTTRSLARHEILFQKGDPGDALYAVRRGQIRIGAGSDDGRAVTLNLLGPGDVFGEIAFLDGHPRTAEAVALEPADLFVVEGRAFLKLLAGDPALAVQIINLLCQRLRWMSARMEEATLLPLDIRLGPAPDHAVGGFRRRDPGDAGGTRGVRRRGPGERQPRPAGLAAIGPDRSRARASPFGPRTASSRSGRGRRHDRVDGASSHEHRSALGGRRRRHPRGVERRRADALHGNDALRSAPADPALRRRPDARSRARGQPAACGSGQRRTSQGCGNRRQRGLRHDPGEPPRPPGRLPDPHPARGRLGAGHGLRRRRDPGAHLRLRGAGAGRRRQARRPPDRRHARAGRGVDVDDGRDPLEVRRWPQERVRSLLERFGR